MVNLKNVLIGFRITNIYTDYKQIILNGGVLPPMRARITKIISLLLIVIFLGGFANNKKNVVFVETDSGKKVALKDFYFGLKKTTKPGSIVKRERASDGAFYDQIYGEEYDFYLQNEIQFKPGTAFGATWLVPRLEKRDQIILKIQLEITHIPKSKDKKNIISIINKRITSFIRGPDFFDLTLESGDPLGDYKISIFNKGRLIASNVFHIRK